MLLRVIDFETTGMEPIDAICQIGRCDVLVSAGPGNERAIRIGPPSAMFTNPGRPIPPEARAIHHIRDRDIDGAPSPDVGLMQLMQANGAGAPDVFCAHNMKFEQQYFTGVGLPWICTYKVGMRLWPDSPNHQNQTLRYLLNIDGAYDFDAGLALPPHRAGPDAYVTAHILAKVLEVATVDQMIDWSNQPSLLPGAIKFGKHKGTPWSKVDPGYLDWMQRQTDMDEDARFTARHWLNRRRADAR